MNDDSGAGHSGLHVARELKRVTEDTLAKLGLLARVFSRCKTRDSLSEKILSKGYSSGGRRLQDFVGVRVVLYFADDVSIALGLLRRRFAFVSETIDRPDTATFQPTRMNVVFLIPDKLADGLRFGSLPIDKTFELQVRTTFSEGWHEVEHDLRYKHPEDWAGDMDLSRALNGIAATVETCDWSMLRLFDDLAHRHYRAGRWPQMLRAGWRLRLASSVLDPRVGDYLTANRGFARSLYRTSRAKVVERLSRLDPGVPVTIDNLVHLSNHYLIKNEYVASLMPAALKLEFSGGDVAPGLDSALAGLQSGKQQEVGTP